LSPEYDGFILALGFYKIFYANSKGLQNQGFHDSVFDTLNWVKNQANFKLVILKQPLSTTKNKGF
jgi:hypothetical protein